MSLVKQTEDNHLLDALLQELYEPLCMPSTGDGVTEFLGQFSDRVTRTLREAMDKGFLPLTTRVIQFVSVLPQDHGLNLPARAIVATGQSDSDMDDLLQRFAFIVHYNIHHNYSFFTQAAEVGLTGGKIHLISRERLPTREDRTRNVFQMIYDGAPRVDVSFLAELPVRSHFVGNREADIGGLLKGARNTPLLDRPITRDYDPEFEVPLHHSLATVRTDDNDRDKGINELEARFKYSPTTHQYHMRMAALAEKAHIVLCAPETMRLDGDDRRHRANNSGLTVLLDPDEHLKWDDVERCYLLAYKLSGLVAGAYTLIETFIKQEETHRTLRNNAISAHILLNPLSNAITHLEAVKLLGREAQDRLVERALGELNELHSTAKTVLSVMKCCNTPIELTGEHVGLADMLRAQAQAILRRYAATTSGLILRVTVQHDVLVDAAQIDAIQLIVDELLKNAKDHVCGVGNTATVGTSKELACDKPDTRGDDIIISAPDSSAGVILEVANGGPPLSQARIDELNLTRSFCRLSRKGTDHYGIGVETCKFLADWLGGKLEYDLEDEGHRVVARLVIKESQT